MLESAEIGHRIAKKDYERDEPKLRKSLLNAQYDLSQSGAVPCSCSSPASRAAAAVKPRISSPTWMDPRHIRVLAFGPPTPEEEAHPQAWRYWRALPPKGKIGIFMNAWYNETLAAHVAGKMSDSELDAQMASIRQHERMLADEGLVLLKFWIHLSKKAQKERLQRARPQSIDPLARHARRLGKIPDLCEFARPVGASPAGDVDRRSPVVRRRRHRRALSESHRRDDPAAGDGAGRRGEEESQAGDECRGRRPRPSSTTSS